MDQSVASTVFERVKTFTLSQRSRALIPKQPTGYGTGMKPVSGAEDKRIFETEVIAL